MINDLYNYGDGDGKSIADLENEIRAGLPNESRRVAEAQRNMDYYNLENERYIPMREAESPYDYRNRPKRALPLVREVIGILADHLYNPGPGRRVEGSDLATEWLERVYADNHVDSLFQAADAFSTLNDVVAFQVAATGDPARPIRLHLFGAEEFAVWTSVDDPSKPWAVCTISRFDARTRYQVWDQYQYRTYYTKQWDPLMTSGGRVAEIEPSECGENPYGVLPFSFVHAETPVRQFWTVGVGTALREANARIDAEISQLAEAVQYYANPIPIAVNVDERWRPVIRPGSFIHVPAALPLSIGGDSPPVPSLSYLQSNLDISGLWLDCERHLTNVLEGMRVPLSSIRIEPAGSKSGVAIVAEQAPLLSRARRRRREYQRYETELARTCLMVAGAYYDRADLWNAGISARLVLSWPEPEIPIPGPDRDAADRAELEMGLASRVQLLMRRRGITREQAILEIERIDEDNKRWGVGSLAAAPVPATASTEVPRISNSDNRIKNSQSFEPTETIANPSIEATRGD